MFVVGSGIIWAFFEIDGLAKIIILSIGSLIALVILIGMVSLHKNIRRLIKELIK